MEYKQQPIIIEFNWMHRCGKWTQIKLLENFLEKKNIFHMSIRWEYYRKWIGTQSDPSSIRWQKNRNKNDIIPLKSEYIKREIRILLLKKISQYNRVWWKGFLLLDRWWVGRCMYNYTEWKQTTLEEALKIKGYNKHLPPYLPYSDLYITLQPTKEELILRNKFDIENRGYKDRKIKEDYDKLYEWFNSIKWKIPKPVLHIKWNYTEQETHNKIIKKLEEIWLFF